VAIFGGLRVAFNHAGISGAVTKPVREYELEEWNRMIAVNLTGVFHSIKAQVPAMRACGGGAIGSTARGSGARGRAAGPRQDRGGSADRPQGPREVAKVALFLASEKSRFVAGHDMALDGGGAQQAGRLRHPAATGAAGARAALPGKPWPAHRADLTRFLRACAPGARPPVRRFATCCTAAPRANTRFCDTAQTGNSLRLPLQAC
jgi:hypothetical protein